VWGIDDNYLIEARGLIFYVDHARAGSCHSYTDPITVSCPTILHTWPCFANEEEYECLIFMNDSNIFFTPIDPTEAKQVYSFSVDEMHGIPPSDSPW